MSDMSLFQHWSTLNAIDRTGDRVHAGLMSLATAQAGAMQRMGAQLEDGLMRIDQSVMAQNKNLDRINTALDGMRKDVRDGFAHIANQMSGIHDRLDRIEEKVSNPEETRAWERFSRAAKLLNKGYPADALDNLKAAIENDGGPAFRHIPEFHLLLGQILIGDTKPRDPDLVDYDAAHCAFRQASLHLAGEKQVVALCRAGAAAFLSGDDDAAIDTYLDALRLIDDRRDFAIQNAEQVLETGGRIDRAVMLRRKLGQIRYTHDEAAAKTIRDHLGQDGSEAFKVSVERLLRTIDQDRYTRYELAKSYLNKGENDAAAEQLRCAIDQDWDTVVLVATDPFYQKHAAWAEALISDYRDHVIGQLASTLPALTHICTGPTERNLGKIADRIEEEARKIPLIDLDTDLQGGFVRPNWSLGVSFEGEKLRSVELVLNALRNQDIGLLDITDILKRKGWCKALGSSVEETERGLRSLNDTIILLEDPSRHTHQFSSAFFKVYVTDEAAKRAQESGARKPSLLGKLTGKKPARSSRELESVRREESMRFSLKLCQPLKSDLELFRERLRKSTDIHKKADDCIMLLNRYCTGQPRFFSPSLEREIKAPTPSSDR